MTPYLMLLALGAAIVALWPISGWAMRHGARPTMFGFVLSVTGLFCGAVAAVVAGKPLWQPTASGLGMCGGVGFAIGFCVLIYRALEIGPTGPTATINNLALIWPILVSLLRFSTGPIKPLVWWGLACTLATLVLMGWQHSESGRGATRAWFLLCLGGFLLAGMNGIAQLLAARWAPGQSYAFCAAMFGVSVLILGGINLARGRGRPNGTERIAGMASGVLFALVVIPLTIILQESMPAYIVLPVSQAGSLIVVVLIGRIFLKERLSVFKWAACACGVAAIVLLTC